VRGRALERHVFEEMRDAVLFGALVAAAGVAPRRRRRRTASPGIGSVTTRKPFFRRWISTVTWRDAPDESSIAARSFGTSVTRSGLS
jgi:hypothetical protein